MPLAPSDVADLARAMERKERRITRLPPTERMIKVIDKHLVKQRVQTGVLGCEWAIPLDFHHESPEIIELANKYVEKGWKVTGHTDTSGPYLKFEFIP